MATTGEVILKTIAAEDLPELLQPGMTVFCAGGMSHPEALVRAINAEPDCTRDVRFVLTRSPSFADTVLRAPQGRVECFFALPAHIEAAEVHMLPMQYRRIADYLQSQSFDLVLLQVAASGPAGRRSFGLSADFAPIALRHSRAVVAEVNSALPAPCGAPSLGAEELSFAVSSDRPPLETVSTANDTARRIGEHVATLIKDGDCLQTGVGAIPDAVLGALVDRRDLGFHSGMFSDGVMRLIEAGALTGARKTRDRARVVTGFVLGSSELYQWLEGRDDVQFRSVDYTHDPSVISSLDSFVSINSAIEVDLQGQVNSEVVNGRQISGVGGAIDFCRGASRSAGGRSIVALPATAARGKVSRIVRGLASGTPATLTRTDVDYVVTELGVARLSGRSLDERSEALIEIAAPEFRGQLV